MAYSIWLVFQDTSATRLQSAIESLSRVFTGPIFLPHLTLVGDLDVDLNEAQRVAEIFSRTAVPSELTVCDIEVSAKYFMALYLVVKIPTELQKAREKIARSANPASYELDAPHVSLLYAHADQVTLLPHQEEIRRDFIDQKLKVAGLNIVQSSKSLPVSDWKAVRRIELFDR